MIDHCKMDDPNDFSTVSEPDRNTSERSPPSPESSNVIARPACPPTCAPPLESIALTRLDAPHNANIWLRLRSCTAPDNDSTMHWNSDWQCMLKRVKGIKWTLPCCAHDRSTCKTRSFSHSAQKDSHRHKRVKAGWMRGLLCSSASPTQSLLYPRLLHEG